MSTITHLSKDRVKGNIDIDSFNGEGTPSGELVADNPSVVFLRPVNRDDEYPSVNLFEVPYETGPHDQQGDIYDFGQYYSEVYSYWVSETDPLNPNASYSGWEFLIWQTEDLERHLDESLSSYFLNNLDHFDLDPTDIHITGPLVTHKTVNNHIYLGIQPDNFTSTLGNIH